MNNNNAPQSIESVALGSTISMLDGVVTLNSWEKVSEGNYTLYVSLGRLKNHPITNHKGMVKVYNLAADVAPWYGV